MPTFLVKPNCSSLMKQLQSPSHLSAISWARTLYLWLQLSTDMRAQVALFLSNLYNNCVRVRDLRSQKTLRLPKMALLPQAPKNLRTPLPLNPAPFVKSSLKHLSDTLLAIKSKNGSTAFFAWMRRSCQNPPHKAAHILRRASCTMSAGIRYLATTQHLRYSCSG